MRCRFALFLAGLMLTQTMSVHSSFRGRSAGGGAAASPNAAVIYWQAFAALPTLEGEQKTKYEAAIKSTTEPVTDDLQPIVARFDTALRELHRARGWRRATGISTTTMAPSCCCRTCRKPAT